jgi:hypothetical protein
MDGGSSMYNIKSKKEAKIEAVTFSELGMQEYDYIMTLIYSPESYRDLIEMCKYGESN